MTSPAGTIPASAYNDYLEEISKQFQESSGYRRWALGEQMKSAQAARDNAMEIARLQASTSRYGVDVASRDRLRQLQENARQFDAAHGLDIQKFEENKRQFGLTHGLDLAKAYTQYASTPDMMFARNDFLSALGRVGQGLAPGNPVMAQTGPQAKTWQDFAALAQYPGPGASTTAPAAGTAPGGGVANVQPPGSPGAPASAAESGGPVPDPRLKAVSAIAQALPPSGDAGHDDNDWAAINAITSLYKAGRPGSVEALGPARQKIALAGLARAGYDPQAVQDEYQRSLPGQTGVRQY